MDEYKDPVRFMVDIPADLELEVDAEDIAKGLTLEQVVDLVILVDDEVGDWRATILLYHHFKRQFDAAVRMGIELASASEEAVRAALSDEDGVDDGLAPSGPPVSTGAA